MAMQLFPIVGILMATLAPPMPAGSECAVIDNSTNRVAYAYVGGKPHIATYQDRGGSHLIYYRNNRRIRVPQVVYDAEELLQRGAPGNKVRTACRISY